MAISDDNLLDAALTYAEMGYPVFPCAPGRKAPLTEHGFQDATTDAAQIERWWTANPRANIAIPTRGLLVLDIDGAGNDWLADDPDRQLELARGAISITPRGGMHYLFRQPAGRAWRNTTGRIAPNVDTRADGGYFLVPPSVVGGKAYRWQPEFELACGPGDLPEPPVWLNDLLDKIAQDAETAVTSSRGDASAPDGNPIPSGQRNATLASLGGAMRRVGMTQHEIAAALHQVNAARCRPPLPETEVFTIAASIARYEPDTVSVAIAENHFAQDFGEPGEDAREVPEDPGPVPDEMLRVPGFISEVMDHTLAIAPYPNRVMAFAGALAMQAFLAGRKVRDPGDNRTNIYLLGLAYSSAGKDWPRKVNMQIATEAGLNHCLNDRFASGEGIQDAMQGDPAMLFQTDEIDGMLQSINKAKDARHENIMSTLLTMYSASNSVFPMRRKAGKEPPGSIDQPCLVIFGTAIPNHYYAALSERMLTNGFFARMLILEAGQRPEGQEPRILDLPQRVIDTAKWWAEFRPGSGNLLQWHPEPAIVEHTDEARAVIVETRKEAEVEYAKAEAGGDPVGTTVWGRVSEHVRKLALIYAVSENHEAPRIGLSAAQWASAFVMHQTRRMLVMAGRHAVENEFDALCRKFIERLRSAPSERLNRSDLLRQMRLDTKTFDVLVHTLAERGDIQQLTEQTRGRPRSVYQLLA